MKVLGKGFRLIIFLVVFIVAFVLFAFVVAARGDDFSRDYGDIMMGGSFCFVGSAFFVLAYDTFYKDRGGKKGLLQKVFTLIGFIITALFGIYTQYLYYQNFEASQNYSPFLFALGAPWLMSGLLTLLLYEVKFKNSNGLLKIALPFISLIVCYIIYVILGFAGGSSAFVYAGIGSVICAILAVVLLKFIKVIGNFGTSTGSESSEDSSDDEEEDIGSLQSDLKNYIKRSSFPDSVPCPGDQGYIGARLGEVRFPSNNHCNVSVVIWVDFTELSKRVEGSRFTVEEVINSAKHNTEVDFDRFVEYLPRKYSGFKFTLDMKVK